MKTKSGITDKTYSYGFRDNHSSVFRSAPGISVKSIEEISGIKGEPEWMREFRLQAFAIFQKKEMPAWGADLSGIDFQKMIYYVKPVDRMARSWDDVPEEIKATFERIGVPEAERKFFAGAAAQYDSDVIYHAVKESFSRRGVIFTDMDSAVKEYPDLVKRYFGTVIPPGDNKFAALNSAVWSGGSFIYIPAGVKLEMPLQAYFRINTENFGQFERTLIIAEEGSEVHYLEGCTAPVYSTDSLHAAVVEIIAQPHARVRYTTVQNWSKNVYNLVTKRAIAQEGAFVEWVDCNLGSKVTMKYPSVILRGRGARADTLSVALAGPGQHQDAGAKMIHTAPDTRSNVLSKSVSFGGGRTSYRGMSRVVRGADNVQMSVRCDAMLMDPESRSDTYPTMKINEKQSSVAHEATVTKVGEEQLFYLQSRGLSAEEAVGMVVNGFIEPIIRVLPLEYAVELNRLIELEMEGSVG